MDIYETEPSVAAFVLRSRDRVLATRVFQLTPDGIYIECACEKSTCPVDGYYFRPWAGSVTAQIEDLLLRLCQEYGVPTKKVTYHYKRQQEVRKIDKLVLPAFWHDPDRIAQATRGFEAMKG